MKQRAPSGQYVRSMAGHRCFVPNPLPPKLTLSGSTHQKIGEVMHLLGQVQTCRRLLPSVEVLIYGSLRREAIASSTIEGTIASADELVLFELHGKSDRSSVREVSNYAVALQHGQELIKARPISLNLILELHSVLLAGVRGQTMAGRLKVGQNHIGSRPNEPIEMASFVPPPPEITRSLMSDLEKYINSDCHEPPLVQIALAHYQFETIHPFGDGNGRVGRLLIILQMMQLGLLDAPLVYPSVYIEKTKSSYIEALQGVRDHGTWDVWIDYFLDVLRNQAKETLEVAEMLLDLREHIRAEPGRGRRAVSTESALDAFFHSPILTTRQLQHRMNVAYNTAKSALDVLIDAGLVERIGDRTRNSAYLCRPLFNLLFFGNPSKGA